MSTPTGMVQLLQTDLDTFAAELETVKSALTAYIGELVANQAVPLPAASEAGLATALADLASLEPPTPVKG